MTTLQIDPIYVNYNHDCKNFNLTNFKKEKNVKKMHEHVTNKYAIQIFEKILLFHRGSLAKIDWNKIQLNDQMGNPEKCNFKEKMSSFVSLEDYFFSPSSIRYVWQALEILHNYPEKTLNIVEIGGGYGGLCYIINIMAPVFDKIIDTYTIVDLPNVSALQAKYLQSLDVKNVLFLEFPSITLKKNTYDLFISNYALGEFSSLIQNYYIDTFILNCSKFIYITWNTPKINPKLSQKTIKNLKILNNTNRNVHKDSIVLKNYGNI